MSWCALNVHVLVSVVYCFCFYFYLKFSRFACFIFIFHLLHDHFFVLISTFCFFSLLYIIYECVRVFSLVIKLHKLLFY